MTAAHTPEPGTAPPADSGPAALAAEQEQPWLRLDRRMLLVHPVHEVVKLLPVLLVSVVLGSQSGNHYWGLIALAVLVAYAIARWLTTSYRIGPVHVQLRTGVFQKKLLSVPRNRIRSVDVEAGLLHRVLGLSIVRIGTGQRAERSGESTRFELNALDASLVPALRAALLTRQPASESGPADEAAPAAATEIAHWSPSWVRYAPLSTTGVLTVAAGVGIAFQYGIGERLANADTVEDGLAWLRGFGVAAVVVVGLLALLAVASALACVRYLLTYGDLTVTDDGRVLHVAHGLLRTLQTTLDRARLRGTSVREPLLLRLAGAARLDAVMTGVAAEGRHSSLLLPQAPRQDVERVDALVLWDGHPPRTPLVPHGPSARRRRYTRALLPVAALAVGVGMASVWVPILWPAWVAVGALAVAAAGLAHDRYRGLGHATPPGRLVTRSGSFDRSTDTLDANGIVGWTVRQTFFQRRAGVATVVAATPAGAGRYEVLDLPSAQAWTLVETVTPGAGDIWARR